MRVVLVALFAVMLLEWGRRGTRLATPAAWQERCTTELLACLAIGGVAGAARWDASRADLTAEASRLGHLYPRVVIADCKLRNAALKSWRFDHCYLARVDFTDADLRDASFDRAIFRACRLVRADLRGTQFRRTAIDGASLGWSVVIDKKTTLSFTGTGENLAGFDPHFRRRAEEDQRIYDIRLGEYNLLRAWYELIDYGRSISRIAMILGFITLSFGLLYNWEFTLDHANFAHGDWQLQNFLLLSAQRLINAPSPIDSSNVVVQSLFFVEGAIGYGALALLVAVLLRKLTILE